MKRWLLRLLSALAAMVAIAGAVFASGRAKDRQTAASKEADLRKQVSAGTHAARVHKEKEQAHREAAAAANKKVQESLGKIASKDQNLGAIMDEFNRGRKK